MNKTLAQEAEYIMSELTKLKDNMANLQLREIKATNNQPTLSFIYERDETYSFTLEEEVVGRDEDKKSIIEMLLNSNHTQETLAIVAIVGMGWAG